MGGENIVGGIAERTVLENDEGGGVVCDERFARGEVRRRIAVSGRSKGDGDLSLRRHWQERKNRGKKDCVLFGRRLDTCA